MVFLSPSQHKTCVKMRNVGLCGATLSRGGAQWSLMGYIKWWSTGPKTLYIDVMSTKWLYDDQSTKNNQNCFKDDAILSQPLTQIGKTPITREPYKQANLSLVAQIALFDQF